VTNLLVGIHASETTRVAGLSALRRDFLNLLLWATVIVSHRYSERCWKSRDCGGSYRLAKLPGLLLAFELPLDELDDLVSDWREAPLA